jgi:diguanylate cyclase (GGDEF)-like protein
MSDGRLAAVPVTDSLAVATSMRWKTADLVQARCDVIVADTVAVFPFSGPTRLDADYCVRLGHVVTRLIADTVRAGSCEPRSSGVVDVVSLVRERSLTPDQFFSFVYLAQVATLDELSLDADVGATTELWPRVSDAVKRAAFDVLAAWTARVLDAPTEAAITDPLTTLHTRPVLEAALAKECQRAERFEHWLALIMLDVDDLAEINRVHGYGVGDRVLERLGILLRSYYRKHDWVARYRDDVIAVLLPETSPDDARGLAERTRLMVEERLSFRDHRTEQRASVTVSTAVICARAVAGVPVDAARVLAEAEAAIARARVAGGNRVEQVEIIPPARPRTDP